jgi:hypothetical protein
MKIESINSHNHLQFAGEAKGVTEKEQEKSGTHFLLILFP